MIKRLISFLLTLVLLVAIPLEARYKYNPYTRKLDWYEAAGDIVLGDIGDITLTGLATGNILYYDGAAWVNLATGANTEVLTLAAGIPSWAAAPAPGVHAASHEVGGADLVDHDQLTNYLAAQHLTLPNTIVAVLTDHTQAAHNALLIDADTVDGEHAAAIVTNARVKAHFPDTIANVLSDHNLLAHTALGLFDQSSDVDHDATTNWVANKHINWTAAADNFSTSEDFTLAWTEAADHASITQAAVAGVATVPLINIDDDRTGVTADTVGEATIVMNAAGTYAFYIQTGEAYFADDTTQIEDVFMLWGDAADHMFIDQNSEDGIEDQPLIEIVDDREGATANEASEASLVITAAGAYAFVINSGGSLFDDSDVTFHEDVFMTWASAADHMRIVQGNAAGIEDQALIYINDDRVGATANEREEATIDIRAEGPDSWSLYVNVGKVEWGGNVLWNWGSDVDNASITQTAVAGIEDVPLINIDDDRTGVTANELSEATMFLAADGTYAFNIASGQAYFQDDTTQIEDVFVTWADALDKMVIAQSAVAGTEDQPLIFIDDDRTGATVNEREEATIYIDAEGSYAMTIIDGGLYIGANSALQSFSAISVESNGLFAYGNPNKWQFLYDSNSGQDDLLTWKYKNFGANDTSAIFIGKIDPFGMTEHNDYGSPTFVLTNVEGADANDYAGVVIGERAQADVKVAHYFDFYAMTGATDGSVDVGDELAAIFRFGASGSATPGYATTPGDVLFEGTIEVDGNTHTAGYNRFAMIYWIECFDHGIAANRYSQNWDITSLNTQGNGTNTIDTSPSHITLTTDNNAIGDNEGTITHFQIVERGRQNRSEIGVALGQTANTQFYCGWNTSQTNAMVAAADEYVIVFFDVSDNANWQIKVGDGATEDIFTSAVAADTNDIRHEIWVETDGTVHWRVNGTELDITGTVDNLMTANMHYLIFGQAQSVTGAAVIVAEIDWVENEKTKTH